MGDEFGEIDPLLVRFRGDGAGKRGDFRLAFAVGFVGGRDVTTAPLLGVDRAEELELSVGTRDGVGVDAELLVQRADRGQLVAFAQEAGAHPRLDSLDDLPVRRDSRLKIECPVIKYRCHSVLFE